MRILGLVQLRLCKCNFEQLVSRFGVLESAKETKEQTRVIKQIPVNNIQEATAKKLRGLYLKRL